jgi:hypothetical protein
MKNNYLALHIIIFYFLGISNGYSQAKKTYSTVDTASVLAYKVEEIVSMRFGGTTTRYTVSDLRLISNVNLGPGNLRIITPIYKIKKRKSIYYVETTNVNNQINARQESTSITEITIENDEVVISDNPKVDSNTISLAVNILTKNRSIKVFNHKEQDIKTTSKLSDITDNKKEIISIKNTRINTTKLQPKKKSLAQFTERVKIKNQAEANENGSEEFAVAEKNSVLKSTTIKKIDIIAPTDSSVKPVELNDVINDELSQPIKSYISINIIDVYERVVKKGYKSVDMFQKIADYYFFKEDMEKAVLGYEKLFAMTTELIPVYYFRFGDALKKTGNTKRGDEMIEKWHQLEKQSVSKNNSNSK